MIENASMERILSRIDLTPIHETKQRLMQHLDKTFYQKIRLERIITEEKEESLLTLKQIYQGRVFPL
jgi:hypothetical protein